MSNTRRELFLAASALLVAALSTASWAEEKVEGWVTRTNLTLCQPRPTGGGCEGTLTLQTQAAGTLEIRVTADTIIRKGQEYTFLPATQGSSVVVSYATQKGQKVAKSIDVVGPGQ